MELLGDRACISPTLLDNAQLFYKMYQLALPLAMTDSLWYSSFSPEFYGYSLFSESLNVLILLLRAFSFPIFLFILLNLGSH